MLKRNKADCGSHRSPPHAATHGDNPQMASDTYAAPNGHDKNYFPALYELSHRIRLGWIVAVVLISGFTHLLGGLVVNGWLSVPAKETDMHEVKIELTAASKELRTLGETVVRLSETSRANERQLDTVDRKLERLLDRVLVPASPAPAASQAERGQRPQTRERVLQ
jgi:hypothetical protein